MSRRFLIPIFLFILTTTPQQTPKDLFNNLNLTYSYSHYILPQRFVFFWTPNPNGTLDIALAAQTNGWVGLGWNPQGTQMVGALACVASGFDVLLYHLVSQEAGVILKHQVNATNIYKDSIHFSVVENYMSIKFTYNITRNNPIFSIDLYKDIAMVFAYSTFPNIATGNHGDNSSTTPIRLYDGKGRNTFFPCDGICSGHGKCKPISCVCDDDWSGSYCQNSKAWDIRGVALIHGVIMYLAFGFLFPFGAVWARYSQDGTDRWYRIHRMVQGTTAIFVVSAITLAIVLVDSSSNIKSLVNSTFHPVLGFSILGVFAIHMLYSMFHPVYNNQPKSLPRIIFSIIHVWTGRVLIIAGWVQVFSGLKALSMEVPYIYGHIGVMGTWVVLGILLEIRKRCFSTQNFTYKTIP